MKKISKNKKGVSEVVGTVLLLGMAIALFVGVHIVALNLIPFTPNAPSVRISGEFYNNIIYLQHNGGDSLPLDTRVIFTYEGIENPIVIKLSDFDSSSDIGKEWNIGEVISYPESDSNLFYSVNKIEMIMIDIETNAIIAQDIFQEVN